jgi:wyosine [tRNA(Phe)-imidazoG37] synthetase (radical SAM superfamily)
VVNYLLPAAPRHVTVSTVGVLKNMYRLSDELPAVNLAFSLHAPNQEVRLKIVPAAKAHPLEKLMEAIDYHILKNNQQFPKSRYGDSGAKKQGEILNDDQNTTAEEDEDDDEEGEASFAKRISSRAKITGVMIEYILIKDINDHNEHAIELAKLLKPRRDYILLNLIPYNPTEVAEDYFPPEPEQVQTFANICISKPYEIHTRVRQEKGQDIAGACGQLALVTAKKEIKESDEKAHTHNKMEEIAMEDIGNKKKKGSSSSSSSSSVTFAGSTSSSYRKKSNQEEDNLYRNHVNPELERYTSEILAKKRFCSTLCYINIAIPVVLSLSSIVQQYVRK